MPTCSRSPSSMPTRAAAGRARALSPRPAGRANRAAATSRSSTAARRSAPSRAATARSTPCCRRSTTRSSRSSAAGRGWSTTACDRSAPVKMPRVRRPSRSPLPPATPRSRTFTGHGLSTNVVEASLRAYLAAVNKLIAEPRRRREPGNDGRQRRVTTYRVAYLPGDGIGPEVTAVARRCVDALGDRFGYAVAWDEQLVGGAAMDAVGQPLPDATLAACRGPMRCCSGPSAGPPGTIRRRGRVRRTRCLPCVRHSSCSRTCGPCARSRVPRRCLSLRPESGATPTSSSCGS